MPSRLADKFISAGYLYFLPISHTTFSVGGGSSCRKVVYEAQHRRSICNVKEFEQAKQTPVVSRQVLLAICLNS